MPKDLEEFLRQRGIESAVIERLVDDKIDCDILPLMDDDALKTYLPAYGDRVAAYAFCRGKLPSTAADECSNALTALRSKWKNDRRGLRRNGFKAGNVSAQRTSRRVELGWMDYRVKSKDYKQVRQAGGGGVRHLNVAKTLCAHTLIQHAKDTFFPSGVSKRGSLEDFDIEIRNFQGMPIDTDLTINDLYIESKLKILRVYMYTIKKTEEGSGTPQQLPSDQEFGTLSSDNESLPELLEKDLTTEFTVSTPVTSINVSTEHEISTCTGSTPVTTSTITSSDPEITTCTGSTPVTTSTITSPDPEVTFNPRSYRLSLRRPSEATAMTASSSSCRAVMTYESINLIEIIDSEDEDIQSAIMESMQYQEANTTRVDSNETSVGEVLRRFQEGYVKDDRTNCVISRIQPLESAIRTLDRKSIKFQNRLFIKFSGEIGQDHGGPRREFFRLAIAELQHSKFFEGPDRSKIFRHDLDLVEKGHYKIIGRLIALSLAQDGPGFHCLNKQLFDIMTGQEGPTTDASDIMDPDIVECLQMLDNVTNDQEREQFLAKFGDWLVDRGINPYRMTVEDTSSMKEMVVKYHIYYRTSSEIAQFKEGMDDIGGMWGVVRKHACLFGPLFCNYPKPITKEVMDSVIRYNFSDHGSNSRRQEDETVYGWEIFLQDIEDGTVPTTMPDLLSFMSGANTIPPCGFQKSIDVRFYSQEEGVIRLPYVSTCSLDMWLPKGQSPETLAALLLRSLSESQGFLKI